MQPGLFEVTTSKDELIEQLKKHPAWEWLWFMCSHINTCSKQPIKGAPARIVAHVLTTHVDHLIWLFGGPHNAEGWEQYRDSLHDLARVLQEHKEVLEAP